MVLEPPRFASRWWYMGAISSIMQQSSQVLETVFAETGALVNSRPLIEVTSYSSDLEATTLNHFLISRANTVLPCGFYATKEISSKMRWREMQVLINQVWARWLRKYQPTLIGRKKWNQSTCTVKVGDLVLVVGDRTQRGDWPLARVMKTFPGKDGTIRVCEVKTKAGLYKKPVAKLALLEECST